MAALPGAPAGGTLLSAPRGIGIWYDEGHRLVARLAETRLTPRTAAAVRELLGGQSLADASLWADRIRGQRRETAPLHYVNIPLGSDRYVPGRDCPHDQCIIAAIERDRRLLADTGASPAERAEALRFLAHLIGDLHQPLHVANDRDRGGNDRTVTFLGVEKNLHEVWDGELVQATGLDEEQYFTHLRRLMDSLDAAVVERGTVVDWAMEGHRVAAERAYRLPPGDAIDRPYFAASLPLVDRALVHAGIRLARVLNEALGEYVPDRRIQPALGPGIYSDREAAAHVGETATVVGTVASVHRSRAGNVYLNFGADYPHQTFSGAVLRPRGPWTRGLDSLAGQRVGVRGRISVYKGQVQIVIERADQIVQAPDGGW
ncbi:MAG TPA: S1/P1 nuclease [Gemmatimonadales bacterium]|nr:S1/P1 nuclease [Gemmatimonadales bacterium]